MKKQIYSFEFDLVADSLKEKLDKNKTIYFNDFIEVKNNNRLDYIISCKAINKKYLILQKVYDFWFKHISNRINSLSNYTTLKIENNKDFYNTVINIAIFYRTIEKKAIMVIE